jgi:hypothetical protein
MTNGLRVESAAPETPTETALFEAGKTLLVETVQVGREFNKFMVGVATGAIATYLTLIGVAVGKNYRPTFEEGVLLLAPTALFLIAAAVFAFGYFPVKSRISLDLPDDIEKARSATAGRRYRCALIGFLLFCLGVAGTVVGAIVALGVDVPSPSA